MKIISRLRTLSLALVATLVAAPAANAGGTTLCISFDNFCDGIEIVITPGAPIAGTWQNWDCVGTDTPFTVVRPTGAGMAQAVCADFASCPGNLLWLFALNLSARTFNLTAWDGVNPPIPVQINQPFTLVPGACPFLAGGDEGVPSTLR